MSLGTPPATTSMPPHSQSRPLTLPVQHPLLEFIAYALYRTRLPPLVVYQGLYLLRRLKQRFPACRGSSGHRLFISALMLASKVLCDDTYSNKSWTIVGQGLFTLRDINTMEVELFAFLDYRVNVRPDELRLFVALLEQGRASEALYVPTAHYCLSPSLAELHDPGGGHIRSTDDPAVPAGRPHSSHSSSPPVPPASRPFAGRPQSLSVSAEPVTSHHAAVAGTDNHCGGFASTTVVRAPSAVTPSITPTLTIASASSRTSASGGREGTALPVTPTVGLLPCPAHEADREAEHLQEEAHHPGGGQTDLCFDFEFKDRN